MAFIAVAVGASALIGGVTSIISGNKAANAQKDAAAQATALQQEQNAEARRQYDLNRADLAPYRETGTAALGKLSGLMGVGAKPGPTTDWNAYVAGNPDAKAAYDASQQTNLSQYANGFDMGSWDGSNYWPTATATTPQSAADFGQNYYNTTGKAAGQDISAYTTTPDTKDYGSLDRNFTLADFAKDPGYDFRKAEGAKATDASAAARGGVLSGGAMKAMERYGQDFASNEYGAAYNRFNNDQTTRFNRLSALAGTGQTATSQGIAAGNELTGQLQTGVNNMTSNINAAGNARASQYAGTASAINGAINGGINNYVSLKNAFQPQAFNPVLNTASVNATMNANPGIF